MVAGAVGGMPVYLWLQILVLGGLVGALGQGARSVVGLKKLSDTAASQDKTLGEMMSASRLFISLAIGFIAGSLAATGIIKNIDDVKIEQILGIAAAGYAGADFIEGFMTQVTGKPDVKPDASKGTATPDTTTGGGVPEKVDGQQDAGSPDSVQTNDGFAG